MLLPMFKASQPRFATCPNFILVLTGLVFIVSISRFACAIEVNSIVDKDESYPEPLNLQGRQDGHGISISAGEDGPQNYKPTFAALGRDILGRAPSDLIRDLKINATSNLNINGSDSPQYWRLRLSLGTRTLGKGDSASGKDGLHELLKREGKLLYITLSICDQPSPKDSSSGFGQPPPPLRLHISTKNPKPDASSAEFSFPTSRGFGSLNFTAASDVYFSVYADQDSDFVGIYNYELTATVGVPYASYDGTKYLTFLDSDSNSALLVSQNLTTSSSSDEWQKHMNNPPPYGVFFYDADDFAIRGIQNSFCGLMKHARSGGNLVNNEIIHVVTSMTNSSGGMPKQYFYVKGLTANTTYQATIALDGKSNSTLKGLTGGTVGNSTAFKTKSDQNCAVIYNLNFCTDTAYAVPYNPTLNSNKTDLTQKYDKRSFDLYTNFSLSLEQIPCETTSEASYSLVRNCTHCAAAYKAWLCAVTIPRCEDFSYINEDLLERIVPQWFSSNSSTPFTANNAAVCSTKITSIGFNSSRNSWIDAEVQPGPWKELLPCKELCHELVRSCPAKLGFSCPTDRWLGCSYGSPKLGHERPTCNDPKRVWRQEAAAKGLGTDLWLVELAMVAVIIMLYWGF